MKFSRICTTIGSLLLLVAESIHLAQAQCSDVHVIFARGSGEMQGLGICGEPLVSGITSNLGGMSVTSYAVNYLASMDQSSAGPGATDMTNHVTSVAQACPNTVFVLGGYSQGASVVSISLGISTMLGSGEAIPETLAPKISAIVTFGNPLKLTGQTIDSSSQTYASKAIEFCNMGDPVCGGGFNTMAHMMYATDGSVATAAQKAAALVQGNAGVRGNAGAQGGGSPPSNAGVQGSPGVQGGEGFQGNAGFPGNSRFSGNSGFPGFGFPR
ncbi:unnamed protein product [Hyaloperonospora brassicae]|uniref:Cutinase n=1 Tax=Hyaloperonospora brassicae TaxID=162125 RepID=A0AAV0UER9_HYABA|nr:unnamed protein product [Hyaloperonospora brassicae]